MPNTTLIKTSTGIDFTYEKIHIPSNTYKKTNSGTYMKLETIREILDCDNSCSACVDPRCFDF
jgi:hypothetical protein